MKKKLLALVILPLLIAGSLNPAFTPSASAVTAADWKAGRIIDDGKFTGLDMSVADIQNFLNAKVPVCDTWGTQPASEYGRSDINHAQYAASRGWPAPPYVCLKNYHEVPKTTPGPGVPANSYTNGGNPPAGSVSAAQMIYNAAVQYRISPKVLLVKLDTESAGPLTRDKWPLPTQYTYAMGAHCPDSGPGGAANCDPNYAGFSIQIAEAAELLRWYLDGMTQSWWQYKKPFQTNYVMWNVAPRGCGGSDVYLQTMGTAALYTYTPYQPNQAALNNMYGTGDNCSAYGNRNFWRVYSDWFGPTTNDRSFFRVIRGESAPEVYLETNVGKYYVPSYALLGEWGLGPENLQVVSQGYVDALPTRNTLSNSLTDGSGNLFVVEGGSTHQVLAPAFTATWNVDTTRMVESLGLSQSLPRKEPLGRFITLSGGDGTIWLVDGTIRHRVDSTSMLYAWGYYPGITNSVSSDLFNRYAPATDISQYATVDGLGIWSIDASTKRPFKDVATSNAYTSQSTPVRVNQSTLNLLGTGTAMTRFVVNTSTGQWFMVDNGSKRYIPNGALTALWGKPTNESLTTLSGNFMNNLATANNVGYTARSSSSPSYWLIAKQKHYIASGDLNIAITGSDTAPDVYSDELINSIPSGGQMQSDILGDSSPYNHPYLLDQGKRRHPSTTEARQVWTPQTMTLPSELLSLIPEGSFINSVVKDASGTPYYTEGVKRYAIPAAYQTSWAIGNQTPTLSNTAFQRFTYTGTIGDAVSTPTGDYVISSGKKLSLSKVRDTFPATLPNVTSISAIAVPTGNDASYLLKSNDSSDARVWFINKGSKIELNFAQQVSLGYLSRGVPVTSVSPSTIAAIPLSTQPFSLLIQKNGSGIKLLNFGSSQGFPNATTLTSYIHPTSGILNVSNSVFESISLTGEVSRVAYDDAGRYWWIQHGEKKYITSWAAYEALGYPAVRAQYLFGTTFSALPTGQEIK